MSTLNTALGSALVERSDESTFAHLLLFAPSNACLASNNLVCRGPPPLKKVALDMY